jgi:hypothetical protein
MLTHGTNFLVTLAIADFVEDPGTVPELDPGVYEKDIHAEDGEGTKFMSQIESMMSDL